MTCVEEECRNYIEKVRRLSLGDEGIVAIQSYFTDIQAQCVEFYFRANLGNDLWLKNVFWLGNRSRKAYKEFGNIVTFDTTYLINIYDISFASLLAWIITNNQHYLIVVWSWIMTQIHLYDFSEHGLSVCTVMLYMELLSIKVGQCKM